MNRSPARTLNLIEPEKRVEFEIVITEDADSELNSFSSLADPLAGTSGRRESDGRGHRMRRGPPGDHSPRRGPRHLGPRRLVVGILMILAAAPDGRAEATDPLPEALRLSDIVTIAVVTPDVGFEDAAMRDKFEAEFQLRLEKKGYRVVLASGTPALRSAFETTLREIASPPLIGRTGGWRLPQTSFQSLADESSADALLVSRVRRHAPGAELENESTACMFPVVVPVVACPIPCVFPRVETTTTDLSVALVEVRTGLIVWMSERSESYGGIRGMASRLVRELPPQRVFVPAPVVE